MATAGQLIDWDDVNFRYGTAPGSGHLAVSGTLGAPAEVRLLEQEGTGDYWEVLVLAFQGEFVPALVTPFEVQKRVKAREGKKGFELVGATKRERISLQPLTAGAQR
jgi:hypothetical protein